ncbi:MAG: 50S ribosomal protein L37e [Candidatus Woesearchaeota archaeon]|nr:MAG: 50S ribosomal protein L37e [Candidatus Woesearchaeota archaeon]
MTKGASSHGKKMHPLHFRCRRCGHKSYHKKTGECSYCGYGKSAKMRSYSWQKKHWQ